MITLPLLVAMTLTLPPGIHAASVYVHTSPTVLTRSGTLLYKRVDEGFAILYCIATPPRIMLDCVVKTPTDKLLLIEVLASERST